MPQICVPLANGFEEIEAISIIDICRRAQIQVIVAGVDGIHVRGAQNISIEADCLIDTVDVKILDMLVLPGGLAGTQILAEHPMVQSLLKQMHQANKHIGAICAAPYALHRANVLSENFTCYPGIEDKIVGAKRQDQAVVINNKVMTSQGVGTALHFALEIVKLLQGEQCYQQIRRAILVK